MSLDIDLYAEVNTGGDEPFCADIFDANITHNLATMAHEAGIYECLWRPDECGIEVAGDLIEPLQAALAAMKKEPSRFIALNPQNGWGSYAAFLPWIEALLEAARKHPLAKVRAHR